MRTLVLRDEMAYRSIADEELPGAAAGTLAQARNAALDGKAVLLDWDGCLAAANRLLPGDNPDTDIAGAEARGIRSFLIDSSAEPWRTSGGTLFKTA